MQQGQLNAPDQELFILNHSGRLGAPYALYAPSGKWNATGGRKVFLAPTQQATGHHFALSALYSCMIQDQA